VKRRLAGAVALVALAGCFEGPTAGDVTLVLNTPNADDGAISFVVTTAGPNEILAAEALCAGCSVFVSRVGATQLRGIVVGDVTGGPLVRLRISNAGPNQAYQAQVLEAASRGFDPRSPSGYRLTVQP
jgi:hypothetical protein